MDGFLCVNKPPGITSFGVIRDLRRALRQRRMGHAGTLDPAATGVLVVAIGQGTRLLPYLPAEPKRYEFQIRFGVETDSLDDTGQETNRSDRRPTRDELARTLTSLTGEFERTFSTDLALPSRMSVVRSRVGSTNRQRLVEAGPEPAARQ